MGIWVTGARGKVFFPVVAAWSSLGRPCPPVAVLALAVPMLGFGLLPTVVALFLYGLLPVVRNTIAGLQAGPGQPPGSEPESAGSGKRGDLGGRPLH